MTRLMLAATILLLAGRGVQSSEPLILQVTPRISPAPGWIRVSARIEPSDDNRVLEIAAVSDRFVRTSSIELDGARAPRLSVFEYPNLPAGEYEVRAVLVGTNGRRVTATRFLQIVPTPGRP